MKRRSVEGKRDKKQQALIERSARIMQVDESTASRLLATSLRQSVRINPLAGDAAETLDEMKKLGWQGAAITWCENGYTIEQGFEELRDSPLIEQGRIYLQNASSWLPVLALAPRPGESVLDLCAAPGGKTSHMAALMGGQGELVANDNSRARLAKLQSNLQRLSVGAELTLFDATRIATMMSDRQFDKILIDAPCSGEGLINLAVPKTLDTWSVAHVRRLSELQSRLITQAWQLLKPGGTLVYSTCTMAPEEDEMVVERLLRRQSDARNVPLAEELVVTTEPSIHRWNDKNLDSTAHARRVFPGTGSEAFFVAKLQKASEQA